MFISSAIDYIYYAWYGAQLCIGKKLRSLERAKPCQNLKIKKLILQHTKYLVGGQWHYYK